jgi:hypothetical protein
LEGIFAAGRLSDYVAKLQLYRRIATMDSSAPIPTLDDQTPTWHRAAALSREWELGRLAARLDEFAASPA